MNKILVSDAFLAKTIENYQKLYFVGCSRGEAPDLTNFSIFTNAFLNFSLSFSAGEFSYVLWRDSGGSPCHSILPIPVPPFPTGSPRLTFADGCGWGDVIQHPLLPPCIPLVVTLSIPVLI